TWLVAIVRILVSSRRPCDSEAFATSSYGTNLAQPLSAATFVSAAVKVVLPWSICPIVPTFTCGLLRSNFSLAMFTDPRRYRNRPPSRYLPSAFTLRATADNLHWSWLANRRSARWQRAKVGADVQDRTGDLVLTKDALCQLSYIGLRFAKRSLRSQLRPTSRPSSDHRR